MATAGGGTGRFFGLVIISSRTLAPVSSCNCNTKYDQVDDVLVLDGRGPQLESE